VDVVLFVLGGLGCIAMMGAMMWVMGMVMARRPIDPRTAARIIGRVRRQGIRTALKSSVQSIAAWAQTEHPDLRRAAAPDGTVTILFSDIEESTVLNGKLGDQRWLEMLRAHNAVVRQQVQAHGGYEVKSQGDGFMVAFSSARRALECAIAIQRAFTSEWNGHAEPLRVRIGLHSGEALKEGNDFYGRNVILAARIAGEADGGEILASSVVKALAESSTDIEFQDERDVELKGLAGTQCVYRVRWELEPGALEAELERLRR
jgi:class 3 adenylate cyclase